MWQIWRQTSAWIAMVVVGKIKLPTLQPARYILKFTCWKSLICDKIDCCTHLCRTLSEGEYVNAPWLMVCSLKEMVTAFVKVKCYFELFTWIICKQGSYVNRWSPCPTLEMTSGLY